MIIIFLILGLIIGSFLNVVAYRLRVVETLWGRSHCAHCRKKVRWYDNVPLLSFLVLSAKCRDCGEKISWIYPVVEFSTGIIFALVGNYFFVIDDFSSYLPTLFYLTVFSMLMVIFVYDLKHMEIPMVILWLAVGTTLLFLLFSDLSTLRYAGDIFSSNLFSSLVSGIGAFLFFFSLSYFSKETWMGYGDAYVGLLAGLVVGWPGIVWSLISSFSIGAIFGIILIMSKQKTMKSQVPFAPFLVIGILLTVFLPEIFPKLKILMFYF